jgi:hypothetical protein
LLRLGSNAVYHLKAPVVVRVSRPGTDIVPVRRTVAVARWLESVDYPAVRAIHVDQPVIQRLKYLWTIRHSSARSASNLITLRDC